MGVLGGRGGLRRIGLGEQRDCRRNQPVADLKIFLTVFLQKLPQCIAVNRTQEALPNLLVAEGCVGLVKGQRPNDALALLTGHPGTARLAILLIVGKAAVRFSAHQQLEAGGCLLSLFLLDGGLHIAVHIKVQSR